MFSLANLACDDQGRLLASLPRGNPAPPFDQPASQHREANSQCIAFQPAFPASIPNTVLPDVHPAAHLWPVLHLSDGLAASEGIHASHGKGKDGLSDQRSTHDSQSNRMLIIHGQSILHQLLHPNFQAWPVAARKDQARPRPRRLCGSPGHETNCTLRSLTFSRVASSSPDFCSLDPTPSQLRPLPWLPSHPPPRGGLPASYRYYRTLPGLATV